LAEIPLPFFLVLDDYHAIHNPSIHRLVGYFLEHQPQQVHQVILTREDPLLPVSRLRSRGQVCEIRQDDLRFTPVETSNLLHQIMGLDLAQDDLDTLQDRTEGWITGLQLAALSLQGYPDLHQFVVSFAGSDRAIFDYLFEEIFPTARRHARFSDQDSILNRLTAGFATRLPGGVDSVAAGSARGNLLSPLIPARVVSPPPVRVAAPPVAHPG
jgi:LuxR family maltose regulon positive regulatory protein